MPSALIILHEPDVAGGEIGLRLAERGFELTEHLVTPDPDQPQQTGGAFPGAADFDLIVPMGSVRSLTRKHEIDSWIHDELDLLAEAHRRGQPILGICFGGQLLAEALGGAVEAAPATEIGWYEIVPVDGVDNPAGPGPWMQWHHDRFHVPPGATELAESAVSPQLFRIGRSVGAQFHPEVTVEMVGRWLAGCDPGYLDAHGIVPEVILADTETHQSRSTADCHRFVDWFLEEVAGLGFEAANAG